MTNLHVLELDQNSLTGQIPSNIGNLTKMVNLSLARNMLYGPIPPSFGNLTHAFPKISPDNFFKHKSFSFESLIRSG